MVRRPKPRPLVWPWVAAIAGVAAWVLLEAPRSTTDSNRLAAQAARLSCGKSKDEVHRLLGKPTGTQPGEEKAVEYWIENGHRVDVEFRGGALYGAWGDRQPERAGGTYGIVYPGCVLPNPTAQSDWSVQDPPTG